MQLLNHKGYYGIVEYSLEDNVLYGKVVGIKGLLSYEGTTIADLKKDFKSVIDDYLADCKAAGVQPEKLLMFVSTLSCTEN